MTNEIKNEIARYISFRNASAQSQMLTAQSLLSLDPVKERLSEKNLRKLKECVLPALGFTYKIEAACSIYEIVRNIEKNYGNEED